MTGLQGAVNIALTLVFILLLKMGLPGVALGTLVPMILFSIVSVIAALRWIEYPGRAFTKTVLLPGLMACALVSGLYWAVFQWLPWSGRMMLFLPKVLALGGVAIALSFLVLFSGGEKRELLGKLAGVVRGGKGRTASATKSSPND
jgi:peptidoglycan biosynthesis protein MviN/MurJ (putative lipid II flippase)